MKYSKDCHKLKIHMRQESNVPRQYNWGNTDLVSGSCVDSSANVENMPDTPSTIISNDACTNLPNDTNVLRFRQIFTEWKCVTTRREKNRLSKHEFFNLSSSPKFFF